jgi:hypothetical protein
MALSKGFAGLGVTFLAYLAPTILASWARGARFCWLGRVFEGRDVGLLDGITHH